jgi:hypothetical protein
VEVAPRWLTDDATPEALVRLLSEQDGAIGAISDEAGLFGILAGRYSSGNPNLEAVLQATSGDPILVDRKAAEPLHVPHSALSIGLALQPGLLPDLAKAAFRHSGLIARFLWAIPEPRVGTRTTEDNPIPAEVVKSWNEHIVALAREANRLRLARSAQPTTGLRLVGTQRAAGPVMLELTPAARQALDRFRRTLEPRLHPKTGDLAAIGDWGSKLPGQAVKIAAAVTLLENPKAAVVEESTMADAIRLVTAYIPHAVATLSQIHGHGADTTHAVEVLTWLTQNKAPTFSVRDVYRALRGRSWVTSANDVQDVLAVLDDYGHVRPVEEPREPGKPGRPSKQYELHPTHLAAAVGAA